MLTLSAVQNDDKPAKNTDLNKKVYRGAETQKENAITKWMKEIEKTILFSGQKRQDFQTLSCCGLAWAPSPSALPCWRITPKPQSARHQGCEALQEASCPSFSLLSVLQATDSWQENSGVIRMPKIYQAAADPRDHSAGLLAPRTRMYCIACKSVICT